MRDTEILGFPSYTVFCFMQDAFYDELANLIRSSKRSDADLQVVLQRLSRTCVVSYQLASR